MSSELATDPKARHTPKATLIAWWSLSVIALGAVVAQTVVERTRATWLPDFAFEDFPIAGRLSQARKAGHVQKCEPMTGPTIACETKIERVAGHAARGTAYYLGGKLEALSFSLNSEASSDVRQSLIRAYGQPGPLIVATQPDIEAEPWDFADGRLIMVRYNLTPRTLVEFYPSGTRIPRHLAGV